VAPISRGSFEYSTSPSALQILTRTSESVTTLSCTTSSIASMASGSPSSSASVSTGSMSPCALTSASERASTMASRSPMRRDAIERATTTSSMASAPAMTNCSIGAATMPHPRRRCDLGTGSLVLLTCEPYPEDQA
jgi:hypothetical protein